jgi:hypothetical protein
VPARGALTLEAASRGRLSSFSITVHPRLISFGSDPRNFTCSPHGTMKKTHHRLKKQAHPWLKRRLGEFRGTIFFSRPLPPKPHRHWIPWNEWG